MFASTMAAINAILPQLLQSCSWPALVALWNSGPLFIGLFVFRYLRFVVALVSYYCLYRPSSVPDSPTLTPADCTVVIPTCNPTDPAFYRCLESVLQNYPESIHVVAVGPAQEREVRDLMYNSLRRRFPNINFQVSHSLKANKRQQVAIALQSVETPITVLCDDHVIWPSTTFLRHAVAPFEDSRVGGVGTKKRVIRHSGRGVRQGFFNVLGALYLERHNFEHTASNALDGGVAVISGRTCLYRTQILQDPHLLAGYLNEHFFFGLFGPLNADDDNYLTRALVTKGWKIKFQMTDEAMIFCDVGEYPKFLQQCLRWARTTFRSNMCSLVTHRSVYTSQPWTVYALLISQMLNFALFYDAALVWSLTRTDFYSQTTLRALCLWVVASKLPKLLPYFYRHPADLVYLPGCYLFAYFHSLLKLYALVTFWDVQWSGRKLDQIDESAAATAASPRPRTPPRPVSYGLVYSDDSDSDDEDTHLDYADDTDDDDEFPTRHQPFPVQTPWGTALVKLQDLHRTPANILQNQRAGTSSGGGVKKPGQAAPYRLQGMYPSGLLTPPTSPSRPLSIYPSASYLSAPTTPTRYSHPAAPQAASAVRNWFRPDACARLHDGVPLRRSPRRDPRPRARTCRI